ncbi:MAG: hypothetical protein OQK29_01355 [Ignavibacteriaceae bacterium]|nr:hypothetical protein [Ignavibacteriaceae bacterium]
MLKNIPCTSAEVVRELNSGYIYHPIAKQRLLESGKVEFCDEKNAWTFAGEKIEQFPRNTKRDGLLNYIKFNKKVTTKEVRAMFSTVSRTYLNTFSKEGYIKNVSHGVWEWADK